MPLNFKLFFLSALLWIGLVLFAPVSKADALSIVYTSSQNPTATIGSGFISVDFTGYVVNNTNAAITFQLTGGPVPFEPYVAGFINGIGYPGITLAAGQSTGTIDLATVNLNPFDPSLVYPGIVNIVLDAIYVDPLTGHTGNLITENDASIRVQTPVPEPSSLFLLISAFLATAVLIPRRCAFIRS